MRAEGRLLVAFVQIAILNGVLGPQISLFRHIGQWETEIACAHISVGKFGLPGSNSQLLRDGFAQFHAGCIDTGSRVIGTQLPARSGRYGAESGRAACGERGCRVGGIWGGGGSLKKKKREE